MMVVGNARAEGVRTPPEAEVSMNENERIKQEQDGLDVYESLLRYAKTGFDSIHPDDFLRLRWFGLYQQKPNVGHFMLRIKVPSGVLTTAQLQVVADVTRI
jgi:sulfite reductase beta subunit-like hemoprotein